jgi:hypothetical protein
VQAYHLTSTDIAAALKAAHERGVRVRAVLDKEAAVVGTFCEVVERLRCPTD